MRRAHLLSVQYIRWWTQSIANPSGESKPSETRTSLEPPWKSIRSIVFWLVLAKYTFRLHVEVQVSQQKWIISIINFHTKVKYNHLKCRKFHFKEVILGDTVVHWLALWPHSKFWFCCGAFCVESACACVGSLQVLPSVQRLASWVNWRL